jgi:hypothetical protein
MANKNLKLEPSLTATDLLIKDKERQVFKEAKRQWQQV